MNFYLLSAVDYGMINITKEIFAKRVGYPALSCLYRRISVNFNLRWIRRWHRWEKLKIQFGKWRSPVVLENGLELIDVEYVKEGAEWYLRLFLDKEGEDGVDLDDCELISRKLNDLLEAADPIAQAYRLEVSSPGIERPLKRTKDFQRFKGEKVQIKTFSDVEGKKQFIGILGETTEDTVMIEMEDVLVGIPRKKISKANLVWEF